MRSGSTQIRAARHQDPGFADQRQGGHHDEISGQRRARRALPRHRRHGFGRGRLPYHQDRHQPVLREDEGRRRGEGERAGHRPEILCRQDRRRQRGAGGRGRDLHRRRRQGYPHHPLRHQGHRADDPEGARRRYSGDRPRHAARPDRCGRRDLRHRQLQGRRADRPVGEGDAGRQGGRRQDRDARPRRVAAFGRRAARSGLPDRLRHRRCRSQQVGRRNRPAHRRP